MAKSPRAIVSTIVAIRKYQKPASTLSVPGRDRVAMFSIDANSPAREDDLK